MSAFWPRLLLCSACRLGGGGVGGVCARHVEARWTTKYPVRVPLPTRRGAPHVPSTSIPPPPCMGPMAPRTLQRQHQRLLSLAQTLAWTEGKRKKRKGDRPMGLESQRTGMRRSLRALACPTLPGASGPTRPAGEWERKKGQKRRR